MNIFIMRILEKKDREMDKENIEEIIDVNFPNLINPLIYTSKKFSKFQIG